MIFKENQNRIQIDKTLIWNETYNSTNSLDLMNLRLAKVCRFNLKEPHLLALSFVLRFCKFFAFETAHNSVQTEQKRQRR